MHVYPNAVYVLSSYQQDMAFSVKNKVALVTGAATGIGLCLAKQLLKSGAKGVALVDVNTEASGDIIVETEKEFGPNKSIFVKADVGNLREFEVAIQQTIEQFGNFDILVNNAAIFNDHEYQKSVKVNLIGTINGINLALENYIPKHRSGREGVILNVSSIAGVDPHIGIPIYTATKFGINGLSMSFGAHYDRTKVKVFSVCPGATGTNMGRSVTRQRTWAQSEIYKKAFLDVVASNPVQTPEFCAEKMVKVIENAQSGTIWIIDSDEPFHFVYPDRRTIAKLYL